MPERKEKNALFPFCTSIEKPVELFCDGNDCGARTTTSHKYGKLLLSRVHKTDFNLKRKTSKGERSSNKCNGWFIPKNGSRSDVIMDYNLRKTLQASGKLKKESRKQTKQRK